MNDYFWRACAICGLLDIIYAAMLSVWSGGSVGGMLRSVASGPLGDAASEWGAAGAIAGLVVHFALMAVMVAAYWPLARRSPLARRVPWLAGALYGLMLYLVMYRIVMPLRWPTSPVTTDAMGIAWALIPHIALVGIPMALIAHKYLGKETPAS